MYDRIYAVASFADEPIRPWLVLTRVIRCVDLSVHAQVARRARVQCIAAIMMIIHHPESMRVKSSVSVHQD